MSEVKEIIVKALDEFKVNIEEKNKDLVKSEQFQTLEATTKEQMETLTKSYKKQEETIVSLQNKLKETKGGDISDLAKSILAFGSSHEGLAKGFLAGEKMSMLSKAVGTITIGNNFTGQVTRFDQRNGIAPIIHRQLRIRQLVRNTVAVSDAYNFRKHTGGEGAIVPTLEATKKGQIDYDVLNTAVPVVKIAGFATASMESLDDTDDFEAFLINELREDYMDVEDTQILYGTGIAPNMNGINTTSLKAADIPASVTYTDPQNWDALLAAKATLASKEYDAAVIVLNPVEYEVMVGTKGTDAHYIANELVFNGTTAMLRGIPIYKSTAVNAGEFFMWDARAQELAMRKSVTVDRSTENGTNFEDNLITFRIEGRAALAKIYEDAAFSDTFANVITAITGA